MESIGTETDLTSVLAKARDVSKEYSAGEVASADKTLTRFVGLTCGSKKKKKATEIPNGCQEKRGCYYNHAAATSLYS